LEIDEIPVEYVPTMKIPVSQALVLQPEAICGVGNLRI